MKNKQIKNQHLSFPRKRESSKMERQIKFAIKSLGCKVNQYEEQSMRENLGKIGFIQTNFFDADVVIVNSCTVTSEADKKTRKIISKIKKDNPNVKIVVTGCYAVLPEDINHLESLSNIDLIVQNKEKNDIPLAISSLFGISTTCEPFEEKVSGFSGHTRAFLKIQDGCNQNCSYCKVSIVRGLSKSRDEKSILEEVRRLVTGGYKEIVLTGICIGLWEGKNGRNLAHLLSEIIKIEGEFRIRISSIEPNHITDEFINVFAGSNKVCKHLHIPLQNGSDRLLKLMNRRYDTKMFADLICKLTQKIPNVGISLDIIVGFPSEKEEDFKNTLDFVTKIRPSRLHVFRYSDRKGTVSEKMKEKVVIPIAKERVNKLIILGESLMKEFCLTFLDKKVEVLIENKHKNGLLEGYTSEYVKCKFFESSQEIGKIVAVTPLEIDIEENCLLFK